LRSLARRWLALDCTCVACGWHYTSALKRAVLLALTRRPRVQSAAKTVRRGGARSSADTRQLRLFD